MAQIARLSGCAPGELESAAGQSLVAGAGARIAEGLLQEAAASDDVMSAESAMAYLELRLAYLGNLLGVAVATEIRRRFAERLRAWE